MLSLDLFNTKYERELREGAVDDLEARRIEDLRSKMDDLVARARKAPTAEVKQALMREFQKCKDERDSYYKVKEGQVTPTKSGIRHHAKPENYGGYEPEADPLARLDKHAVNRADKAMGVKFNREKKYQGGLDVDEGGIPGSVPVEKIPGKEDLLKGKGRSYYEADQKKNSEVSDPTVDRLLTRARRDFPKARSDAEALAMKILSKEQDDVARLDRVNDREDHMIDRLADLEANLQHQIDQLKQSAELDEGHMSEIDAMRQDLERMNDRQFYTAYGISKAAFQQKYRTLLKPANIDEHGGGIGPKQRWQDLMQENKLSVGDPIVVTGPNKFEGKTGEIAEFSPSGKFVVVDLYNHGQHSMHLSDVEYNQYAADQDEEDDWYDEVDEGFQDFNKVEPYAVCLAGKPVKKFDYYEQARKFHDNWKQKLYREGDKAKADTITLMPLNLDEEQKPAGWGEFPPKQEITIVPPKKLKSGETYQDRNKYWQSQGQAPIYKTNEEGKGTPVPAKDFAKGVLKDLKKVNVKEAEGRVDPILIKALKRMPDGLATHGQVLDAAYDAYAMEKGYLAMRGDHGVTDVYIPKLMGLYKDKHGLTFNEAKADPAGSWIVYGGSRVMKFKTHSGAKAYAEKNGGKVASSEHYHDKIQKSGVGEAIVASGPSRPLDDRAVRKLVWDTMKINADTGEQAIQRALSVLAKKPQSRMVLDLQDKFQNLSDRLAQGIAETVTDVKSEMAQVYRRLAPKIERYKDSFLAGQLYDELENIAELHGAEAEFKRMLAGARNRAHMDYDTNPGGFQNWFWYLPFAEEKLSEEQDTAGVERAILNRIMVAHTDLLMKFGPEKVMQAAEEVAYNVGDVDEIGTSDVSAYVAQVKQILGVPKELDEKWSQKYKSSINCAKPKGFSQKAHCAGRKK